MGLRFKRQQTPSLIHQAMEMSEEEQLEAIADRELIQHSVHDRQRTIFLWCIIATVIVAGLVFLALHFFLAGKEIT